MCLLILSGAYVADELQAEVGAIPPAFLPVGNKRLFTHQICEFKEFSQQIYLSIPASFEMLARDDVLLKDAEVKVIRVSEELTVGEALLEVLSSIELMAEEPLHVLLGDTLFRGSSPPKGDAITVHLSSDNYRWAYVYKNKIFEPLGDQVTSDKRSSRVVSGYFCFADVKLLSECLLARGQKFIEAIQEYHRFRPFFEIGDWDWLDFGHLQTFHRSRFHLAAQRHFNHLTVTPKIFKKTSDDHFKMDAESAWYENIPSELRVYTPQYLGRFNDGAREGYILEAQFCCSLSDLYMFSAAKRRTWAKIFEECYGFICSAAKYSHCESKLVVDDLYLNKTLLRLEEFCQQYDLDIDQPWMINGEAMGSLASLAETSFPLIKDSPKIAPCVMHGDFCFSNILYDFRSEMIKVIDPRGYVGDSLVTIYGDPRYDIAKFAHSIVGGYDLILAGYFDLEASGQTDLKFLLRDDGLKHIQEEFFGSSLWSRFDEESILAIVVHLFLSMLPLHVDRPACQLAFVANAFRVNKLIEKKKE